VIPNHHRSETVTVQTSSGGAPYDTAEAPEACPRNLADCFYVLLEDEDLEKVFFEFIAAAHRPK